MARLLSKMGIASVGLAAKIPESGSRFLEFITPRGKWAGSGADRIMIPAGLWQATATYEIASAVIQAYLFETGVGYREIASGSGSVSFTFDSNGRKQLYFGIRGYSVIPGEKLNLSLTPAPPPRLSRKNLSHPLVIVVWGWWA